MDQNELTRRAIEERAKAASARSNFSRDMHLQIAEQFERRATMSTRNGTGPAT